MKDNTTQQDKTTMQDKIILACSEASDLGELADRVARKIRNITSFKMKCLAMIAADDKGLINTMQSSDNLVIDGCGVDCGKKIMEEAWLSKYRYVRLTDFGYVKGQTPVTEDLVNEIAEKIISSREVGTTVNNSPAHKKCCAK